MFCLFIAISNIQKFGTFHSIIFLAELLFSVGLFHKIFDGMPNSINPYQIVFLHMVFFA